MSKENADEAMEKIKEVLGDKFPTFILFCVGSGGGFALGGFDEKLGEEQANSVLAAQIQDTLTHNPGTLAFFKVIIANVETAKAKIN